MNQNTLTMRRSCARAECRSYDTTVSMAQNLLLAMVSRKAPSTATETYGQPLPCPRTQPRVGSGFAIRSLADTKVA